jgi:hypothetical protein
MAHSEGPAPPLYWLPSQIVVPVVLLSAFWTIAAALISSVIAGAGEGFSYWRWRNKHKIDSQH